MGLMLKIKNSSSLFSFNFHLHQFTRSETLSPLSARQDFNKLYHMKSKTQTHCHTSGPDGGNVRRRVTSLCSIITIEYKENRAIQTLYIEITNLHGLHIVSVLRVTQKLHKQKRIQTTAKWSCISVPCYLLTRSLRIQVVLKSVN